MSNKIAGAILLAGAGIVTAVGAVGVQITNLNTLVGFLAWRLAGTPAPKVAETLPSWLVLGVAALLALIGVFLLVKRNGRE